MGWAAALPAVINAAAAITSGILNRKKGSPMSGIDKRKKNLIDELISSLQGGGKYSDLYNPSEQAFQKSFVEPSLARFRNQVTPQIQQSYIQSGMQRGTGLEDSLNRAGVNMNQLLNENYYKFQQDALNRKQNSINNILNTSYGEGQKGQSALEAGGEGFSGYLSKYGEKRDVGQDLYSFFNDLLSKDKPKNEPDRIGYAG